jgi:hypothetical protein
MAGKDKTKGKYYEVTKERKASTWEITLSVGAIGAALGFFTALFAGACSQSATLDYIVVISLLATVLGFGIGLLVSWLFQKYFGNLLEQVSKPIVATQGSSIQGETAQASPANAVDTNAAPSETEEKGQSVDYVFPEFSPDQR